MTETLEVVLTTDMLRTAIRSKLRTGTSRQPISALIRTYAPDGAEAGRRKNAGTYRIPLEAIPHERRTAFLDALHELPSDSRSGMDRFARLVG